MTPAHVVSHLLAAVVGALGVMWVALEHPHCNANWRPEMEIVREHLGIDTTEETK